MDVSKCQAMLEMNKKQKTSLQKMSFDYVRKYLPVQNGSTQRPG